MSQQTNFRMSCKKYVSVTKHEPVDVTGQKRCQICEIPIQWDGLWCPCCGNRVKTKPHALHLRAKLLSSIPRSFR